MSSEAQRLILVRVAMGENPLIQAVLDFIESGVVNPDILPKRIFEILSTKQEITVFKPMLVSKDEVAS